MHHCTMRLWRLGWYLVKKLEEPEKVQKIKTREVQDDKIVQLKDPVIPVVVESMHLPPTRELL